MADPGPKDLNPQELEAMVREHQARFKALNTEMNNNIAHVNSNNARLKRIDAAIEDPEASFKDSGNRLKSCEAIWKDYDTRFGGLGGRAEYLESLEANSKKRSQPEEPKTAHKRGCRRCC